MQAQNPPRPPSHRNCRIYQRHVLEGQSQDIVAAEFQISRQRVAQVAGQVEGWIAAHPEHPLAQAMRVRLLHRWEALWTQTMAGFERSRENREVVTERTLHPPPGGAGEAATVVVERTVRQHPGDVRFLNVGVRVTDRQQRLWPRSEATAEGKLSVPCRSGRFATEGGGAGVRFPFLPAALCDLADLARGERGGSEGVDLPGSGSESLSQSADQAATPVSTLFERRVADAFRSLGFVVRQLGQGCGRAADCLALAAADRFGVILDAKTRRAGYTLGTDDRQFCDYATRHSRELARSGIDRVYFVVVGSGFRQHDLENLAGFMAAEPIRSVLFIEAHALMRLVNDSIRDRADFRLADLDRLFFGNKILEE
jgi:hypothetical protein